MSYLKAIEAGVDIIDAGLAPLAQRSAPPAVESIVGMLRGTGRDSGLDLTRLLKLGDYVESIVPKYRGFIDSSRISTVDTGVLVHQIPGGMISNLVLQLKQSNALDKLTDVFSEMPRTRKDLGYPPLVTPTSQIVGVQAFYNVTFGRYKQLTTQLMDYCYGMYGKPPAPIDPEVQQIVLKHYKRGQTPYTGRPADLLPPELDTARDTIKGISADIGDVLTCALYPVTGLKFVQAKYGQKKPAPAQK